jgi:hypothetical protein
MFAYLVPDDWRRPIVLNLPVCGLPFGVFYVF